MHEISAINKAALRKAKPISHQQTTRAGTSKGPVLLPMMFPLLTAFTHSAPQGTRISRQHVAALIALKEEHTIAIIAT